MITSRKATLDAVALVTLVVCCATWGLSQVADHCGKA